MDKRYTMADYYPYLIVSDNIKTLDGKTDLLLIDPFQRKDTIKSKAKRGLGIEISIAFAKKLNATMVGKWLKEVKSIYEFCKSNDCQFILSSGARSINELVSARSFESILKLIGVSPKNYWNEISEWLYTKNKVRWVYAKP
jgi:RNase P/RNase MRP subunit p30